MAEFPKQSTVERLAGMKPPERLAAYRALPPAERERASLELPLELWAEMVALEAAEHLRKTGGAR